MSDGDLLSGIVTFWFSDIERSTRLLQDLGEDRFASVLEEHHGILTAIVGPAFVSTGGDSFFCAFDSPVEAVRAAAEAQRRIETHDWPDEGRVRVRIGMHTGPALIGGSDYVGLDVHRASRISSAGHGGQVLLSDATRALVDRQLPAGTSLVDLGEHRLKDLLVPERLFQLNIEGLQPSFPPVVSDQSGELRLPEPATSFVGRKAEIVEVAEALRASRLVSLVGMGGVGKTRLAIRAAELGGFDQENSVFFVALERATDRASVAKAVANALALSEQAGRAVEDTLTEFLQPRADLLIFDNCEHVIDDAASLVGLLLVRCPKVRILATTREPLMIDGENVVDVGPLPVEGRDREASDAVDLFVERAAAASSDFDPAHWAHEIESICQRLDGIPLAIELAAARVPVLTPGEILALLKDRFSVLASRRRGASPRHQTLEATLDWSYDLLTDEQRHLLCQLSVFRGGFSLEAVGRTCYAETPDPSLVLDRLTSLNERSLLRREIVTGQTRFFLLETVREYAERKLVEEFGEETVLDRHRAYFVDFVKEQAARLDSNGQLDALNALEADHDNVREVIDRAVAQGQVAQAADLAGRLSWFWYVHGHFMEGERRAESLLATIPDHPDRSWLRLLTASAQFDYRLGHFDRAADKLKRAVDYAERSEDKRLEMWAHAYAATNEAYRMRLEDAVAESDRARALAEEQGDLLAFGYSKMVEIGSRAAMLEADGSLTADRAAELNAEMDPIADVADSLGERNMIGHTMEAVGVMSYRSGDLARAQKALDQSIVALTELGTTGCACHCLEVIAMCAAESGLLDHGVRLIGASDGLREKVGIKVSPLEAPFREKALEVAARSWSRGSVGEARSSAYGLSIREAMHLARETVGLL